MVPTLTTNDAPPPAKVPVGLATQSGLVGAVAQFIVALVTLISGGPTEVAIGVFGTATATLMTVVIGRMSQAKAATAAAAPAPQPIVISTPGPPGPTGPMGPTGTPAEPEGVPPDADDSVHALTDGDPAATAEPDEEVAAL